MNPLMAQFISESRDLVDAAGEGFLRLEKAPDDADGLNEVFRSVHTLKGASGLFDIRPFTSVVHAAEDLLDRARDGSLRLSPDMIDLFLEAQDLVVEWLGDLESNETLASAAEARSNNLSSRMRAFLAPSDGGVPVEPKEAATDTDATAVFPWVAVVPEDCRRRLFTQAVAKGKAVVALTYAPDEQCFFAGDDPILTVRQINGLSWQNIELSETVSELADFDPFQCVVRFRVLAEGPIQPIHHLFRYVDDRIVAQEFPAEALVVPTGRKAMNELFQGFVEDARSIAARNDWPRLSQLAAATLELADPDSIQSSALRWLGTVLDTPKPDLTLVECLIGTVDSGELTAIDTSAKELLKQHRSKEEAREREAVDSILTAQLELLSLPCDADLWRGRVVSVGNVLMRIFTHFEQKDLRDRVEKAVEQALTERGFAPVRSLADKAINYFRQDGFAGETQSIATAKAIESANRRTDKPDLSDPTSSAQQAGRRWDDPPEGRKSSVLKVDQSRIDSLMGLAGELIVAKNSLPFLAKRAEEVFGVKELSREISSQYDAINRISDELQEAVMQVRMVPMSHVFSRFSRLVRDLARKLNKPTQLIIEGEGTEADKNIVESLADPLIHLIRNAIDHGIETPGERRTAGKNPQGEIRLSAAHLGDQVVVEVRDDGHGIDPGVIKRKAYEKGLIDEDALDTINDQEAIRFILAPGFSTAEKVSDLSGRGVGMDVVRTMVEQCGGSISIQSEKGKGTCIGITLPLSMAVTRVMMIEVDEELFGINIDDIVETVRVATDTIHRIKDKETLILRDRLVPVFDLARTLGLPATEKRRMNGEMAVLVARVGGEEVGLIVDRFHQGVDVIQKPMEGIMSGFSEYSGTALLGDGRVLLILNMREMGKCL